MQRKLLLVIGSAERWKAACLGFFLLLWLVAAACSIAWPDRHDAETVVRVEDGEQFRTDAVKTDIASENTSTETSASPSLPEAGTAAVVQPVSGQPQIDGCGILPPDDIWNMPVDGLPVHAMSGAYIASIGDGGLHADFGSGTWEGQPIGIPYTVIGSDQPFVEISFLYDDESDPGPYPVPPQALIEGGESSDGDRHILLLDTVGCLLYEIYAAYPQADGSWQAGSGAVFDLKSSALRPAGWTSADAAGLPILPGLVRYDEIAAGEIRHAIRFTASQTQRAYVWPARHYASDITDVSVPPMGQRFRLKASFDTSVYPPELQVLLQAFKTYGLVLADNGSDWYISGVPDERWDNEMLHLLHDISGANFEAVDVSSLMVQADSGQARSEYNQPQE